MRLHFFDNTDPDGNDRVLTRLQHRLDNTLVNMAIAGNIVTSWSWFGVNMPGIGLHSYGFMDAAFYWLMAFVILNLALIALGSMPVRMWQSFRGASEPVPAQGEE